MFRKSSLCLAVAALAVGLTAATAQAAPTISVATSGRGAAASFTVTGSGFKPNAQVRIRFVDDALTTRNFTQSATPQGKLKAKINVPVISGLRLHISATDGTPNRGDLTGVLWSNTVTLTAP